MANELLDPIEIPQPSYFPEAGKELKLCLLFGKPIREWLHRSLEEQYFVDRGESVPRVPITRYQVIEEFFEYYGYEFIQCLDYARECAAPSIRFGSLRETPQQIIFEFSVSELATPETHPTYNWHGQETSKWRYAGAIVIDKRDGSVSSHH